MQMSLQDMETLPVRNETLSFEISTDKMFLAEHEDTSVNCSTETTMQIPLFYSK